MVKSCTALVVLSGSIALGLLATADGDVWQAGLFYGGGTAQLVTQVIGMAAIAVIGAFVALAASLLLLVLRATVGLRVGEEELEGLDVMEHGASGYASESPFGGSSALLPPPAKVKV